MAKKILGVCGILAKRFGIDATVIRATWLLLSVLSLGTGAIIYLMAFLFVRRKKWAS